MVQILILSFITLDSDHSRLDPTLTGRRRSRYLFPPGTVSTLRLRPSFTSPLWDSRERGDERRMDDHYSNRLGFSSLSRTVGFTLSEVSISSYLFTFLPTPSCTYLIGYVYPLLRKRSRLHMITLYGRVKMDDQGV